MTVVDAVHGACPSSLADEACDSAAEGLLADLLCTTERRQIVVTQVRDPGRDRHGMLEADLLVSPSQRLALEGTSSHEAFDAGPGGDGVPTGSGCDRSLEWAEPSTG